MHSDWPRVMVAWECENMVAWRKDTRVVNIPSPDFEIYVLIGQLRNAIAKLML